MSSPLDRDEFWLLTNAVESQLPFGILTLPEWPHGDNPDATIDVVLNKRGHGLDRRQLADTLLRMLGRGWIELSRITQERRPPDSPDHSEMIQMLDERGLFCDGVYYGLTAKGGAVWEAFARPEWDRYVGHTLEFADPDGDNTEVHEIVATDRKRLRRYMEAVAYEMPIEAGSEDYTDILPWQATYWKSLPVGVRCTFRVSKLDPSPSRPPSSEWLRGRWCPWL